MVVNFRINSRTTLSAYFKYSESIRRIIYTTNTVKEFNRQIRKITKTKGEVNSDESLMKLVFQTHKDISRKWENPSQTGLKLSPGFLLYSKKDLVDILDKIIYNQYETFGSLHKIGSGLNP